MQHRTPSVVCVWCVSVPSVAALRVECSCRPAPPYMYIYVRVEGKVSAQLYVRYINPPSLRPGGYRSHGTQSNQLSSRRACPSPHAAVPREAAAVEGVPLEFRTSSPLHSSGSLAHSYICVWCVSVPSIVTPNAKCCLHLVREGAERYNTKARVFSCRPAFPYMSIYMYVSK